MDRGRRPRWRRVGRSGGHYRYADHEVIRGIDHWFVRVAHPIQLRMIDTGETFRTMRLAKRWVESHYDEHVGPADRPHTTKDAVDAPGVIVIIDVMTTTTIGRSEIAQGDRIIFTKRGRRYGVVATRISHLGATTIVSGMAVRISDGVLLASVGSRTARIKGLATVDRIEAS